MRISSMPDYLGGADNTRVVSILRGEQLNYTGTVNDSSGMPMDLSLFTISAVAEFHRADITISGSGSRASVAISNVVDPDPAIADRTLTVTKDADPTTGQFVLTIPEDLATDSQTAGIDTTASQLLPVVYITYNDGATPATIRKSRLVLIVRHSG